jgi:hypothetical protein
MSAKTKQSKGKTLFFSFSLTFSLPLFFFIKTGVRQRQTETRQETRHAAERQSP